MEQATVVKVKRRRQIDVGNYKLKMIRLQKFKIFNFILYFTFSVFEICNKLQMIIYFKCKCESVEV